MSRLLLEAPIFISLIWSVCFIGEEAAYFKVKPAQNEGEKPIDANNNNNDREQHDPAQQVIPPDVEVGARHVHGKV